MTLAECRPGTRVRICGKMAVLLFVNDCRAHLRLEGEAVEFVTADGHEVAFSRHKTIDVAPTAEVEVLGKE